MPELINKQSALSVCKEYCWLDDEDFVEGYNTAIKDMREAIKELPTIEPEVRNGGWIAVSSFDAFGGDEEAWMAHGNPTAYHYCSECKNESYLNEEGKEILSDYCPFCGAQMDGGAENG